ncbi:MAG: hypothetical protein OEX00_04420, partial [Gammaproteobacteria bacterium]|nr:hypothetical protein [Gammaproteobacteria bacterium]
MATLEPRRVAPQDIVSWVKESVSLLFRRVPLYLSFVLLFFLLHYLGIKAVEPIAPYVSPVLVLAILFTYLAVVFVFVIAGLILVAYSADHSRRYKFSEYIHGLLAGQTSLMKIAIFALFIGSFYWVISYTINPNKDLMTYCEKLVTIMLAQSSLPIEIETRITAAFLYFCLLATFSLRIFYSFPLILFHEANYNHAQALTHRAILINIVPMTVVILMWSMVLLGTMLGVSFLSVLLLPVFANFIYVSYRHIFLGVAQNLPARALSHEETAS